MPFSLSKQELNAALDILKGAGWSTETLKNIRDQIGSAGAGLTAIPLPVIATRVVERPTSVLPQGTQADYFAVTGRVIVTQIVGEVTAVIEGGANNMKLISNPSVGADVDLCTAVDIDSDVVGTMYGITGTVTDAMISPTSGAFTAQDKGLVVANGTIDLHCTGSKTGEIKWTLHYIPLDSGSIVTAV